MEVPFRMEKRAYLNITEYPGELKCLSRDGGVLQCLKGGRCAPHFGQSRTHLEVVCG